MSRQNSQSKMSRAWLVQAMKTGEYAQCAHLPPESVLAEKLGISRTQLRDVLAGLEREGFITRRHGVGTVINRHVLAVTNRMDIEVEFMDMIRQSGYTPGLGEVRVWETQADESIARQLNIPVGAPVLCVSRLCTADGKPAIYCEDILDKAKIRAEYTEADLQQPIFDFLAQFCGLQSYMDLTRLGAVAADARLAELLQVEVGAPLLYMEEVDYDIEGRAVFCSREYFADGFCDLIVLRKKLE